MDDLDALAAQVAELTEQHDVNAMQSSVQQSEGTRKTALQHQAPQHHQNAGVGGRTSSSNSAPLDPMMLVARHQGSTASADHNTSSSSSASSASTSAPQIVAGASLFIGGLDARTTEMDLRAVFGSCGPIKRLTIVKDRHGQPKGHAFVEFEHPSAVPKAVLKNGQSLHGKPLKVDQKVDFSAAAAVAAGLQQQQQQQPGQPGARPHFLPQQPHQLHAPMVPAAMMMQNPQMQQMMQSNPMMAMLLMQQQQQQLLAAQQQQQQQQQYAHQDQQNPQTPARGRGGFHPARGGRGAAAPGQQYPPQIPQSHQLPPTQMPGGVGAGANPMMAMLNTMMMMQQGGAQGFGQAGSTARGGYYNAPRGAGGGPAGRGRGGQ